MPQDKDVSITCQVTLDPLAEVYWTFNGSQSLKTSDRIGIIQEIERPNILRSVLNINSADGRWNGTFSFVAENNRGKPECEECDFVTKSVGSKTGVFCLVAVGALMVFVITVICFALVFIFICGRAMKKHQSDHRKSADNQSDYRITTYPRDVVIVRRSSQRCSCGTGVYTEMS